MAVLTVLFCVLSIIVQVLSSSAGQPSSDLTDPFIKKLSNNNFNGFTYGILVDDRLVAAGGQGQIRGHTAHPGTLLPVLGISKLLTAVAVLQLMEDGSLNIDDRVFGNHGLLYYVRTEHESHMDSRLKDITVRDLLYHTAGWDETKGPVYDPMLNAFYVRNGYNVVDISREMEVYGILSYDEIMRFMVTQPLHHDPGTQRVVSNFGYSVLGRIIEEVTDMTYEDYVKEHILQPFGMWHTRMGPSYSNTHQAQKESNEPGRPPKMGYIPLDDSRAKSLFDIVPPIVLDSCLGWHSNIYDLSRFFSALFLNQAQDEGFLDPSTVDGLILEPGVIEGNDYEAWDGIGVSSNYNGEIWYKTFHPDIGVQVSFYHQQAPFWNDAIINSIGVDMTVLLIGVAPDDHPKIVNDLTDWVHNGDLSNLPQLSDIMNEDLADIVINTPKNDYMVIENLGEHHLLGYLDALRLAEFSPVWLQGYTHHGHTNFVVISRKAKSDKELDFVVLERSDKNQLISDITQEIEENYQLCYLHSFNSAAHEDGLNHLAILKSDSDNLSVEFDIACDLDVYSQHVEAGLGNGYLPTVQSIDVLEEKVAVSYILKESPTGTHVDDSISSLDLSLDDLKLAMNENSQRGYILEYLDTFMAHGQPRFSAIFRKKEPGETWIMSSDVETAELPNEINKWVELNYVPRIIVGYSSNYKLYYFIVFKADN